MTRSMFATVTMVMVIGGFVARPASAQYGAAPNRSVQAVPPAQGSLAWGQDNCLYRFQGGRWYSMNQCRQPQASARTQAEAARLQALVNQLNALTQAERARQQQAARNPCLYPPYSACIGGTAPVQTRPATPAEIARGTGVIGGGGGPMLGNNPNTFGTLMQHDPAAARQLMDIQNRMNSIWTAPNCVSSYNGCR
jgi:hypothetical protein